MVLCDHWSRFPPLIGLLSFWFDCSWAIIAQMRASNQWSCFQVLKVNKVLYAKCKLLKFALLNFIFWNKSMNIVQNVITTAPYPEVTVCQMAFPDVSLNYVPMKPDENTTVLFQFQSCSFAPPPHLLCAFTPQAHMATGPRLGSQHFTQHTFSSVMTT